MTLQFFYFTLLETQRTSMYQVPGTQSPTWEFSLLPLGVCINRKLALGASPGVKLRLSEVGCGHLNCQTQCLLLRELTEVPDEALFMGKRCFVYGPEYYRC